MKHQKKRRKSKTTASVEVIVFDSAYVPGNQEMNSLKASFGAPFAVLEILAVVLAGAFASAFGITLQWHLLLPVTLLFSAFFVWFYLEKRIRGYRLLAGLFLTALYGGVCFVLQRTIQHGFYGAARCIAHQINQTYAGNLTVAFSGTPFEITVFLLAVLFPVTAVLAAAVIHQKSILPIIAVLFPVLAAAAVAGGNPSDIWMYLILVGILVLLAGTRSFLPGWKTAFFAGLLAVIISVPSWYLVKPLLALPASDLAKSVSKVETRLMQSLYQILPRISGGRLNLSIEGVGGGVEDGTLGAVDGYYFTGVETLRVTSDQKPQETVYLKGYVGQEYTGTSYEAGSEDSFYNAAASWKTEGNASLYIQNLSFLRMMYYENYGGSTEDESEGAADGEGVSGSTVSDGTAASESHDLTTTANTITVENINANTAYTYIPYQGFLSDTYQIYGGDGYVGGQTVQDDIFPCYWRSSYKEAMEAYRDDEEDGGVLDSVEESYRAYCTQHDLEIPEEGLERLKEECAAVAEEEKWNQKKTTQEPDWARADEIEEIRQYVIKRLLSTCEYELDVDALPEGEDFIEYFLYETQEGYSMHFAAAATMMFRMFGVPARYVVGYVAPKELFTRDENGTYTAILEDDNAHAWTEVYMPFLGWTPVEVTPGMEAELEGDLYMEETESETQPETEAAKEDEKESKAKFRFRLPSWLKGNLETVMTVVQVFLLAAVILYILLRIRRQRRHRLGLGRVPAERIQALYHSLYRILVLSGMPKECTIADPNSAALLDYLADYNTELSGEDMIHLQQLILQTNYGQDVPAEEDADWVFNIYRSTWRVLCRKIPMRKRLGYLWKQ